MKKHKRKLIRRKKAKSVVVGVLPEERYTLRIDSIRHRLGTVISDITWLETYVKDPDRQDELHYAREYCTFANERLGDTLRRYTAFIAKLQEKEPKKKLMRRSTQPKAEKVVKKRKLMRRKV